MDWNLLLHPVEYSDWVLSLVMKTLVFVVVVVVVVVVYEDKWIMGHFSTDNEIFS